MRDNILNVAPSLREQNFISPAALGYLQGLVTDTLVQQPRPHKLEWLEHRWCQEAQLAAAGHRHYDGAEPFRGVVVAHRLLDAAGAPLLGGMQRGQTRMNEMCNGSASCNGLSVALVCLQSGPRARLEALLRSQARVLAQRL